MKIYIDIYYTTILISFDLWNIFLGLHPSAERQVHVQPMRGKLSSTKSICTAFFVVHFGFQNDSIWLVGGLVAIFYFPIYWVANHPNWLIFFRGVGIQPPTRWVFWLLVLFFFHPSFWKKTLENRWRTRNFPVSWGHLFIQWPFTD